jgi:hypothetical protein
MNYFSIKARRKGISVAIIILFTIYNTFAQVPPQGFFLDSWTPKNIENPTSFQSALQTTTNQTVLVTIDAANTVTKVSKNIFGLNMAAWNGKSMLDAAQIPFVNNIKELNLNLVRWPGGDMSNDYFWNASSKETCPKDLPPTHKYDKWGLHYGANNNSWTLSLDQFYTLLQRINSSAIMCVNYAYARYGTSANPVAQAAHYAADWVRYDKGRTKYWEIGNENYGYWETGYIIDKTLNKDGQPDTITGDIYGKHCIVFIDSMRAAAREVGNDIRIGVVVYNEDVAYEKPAKNWNKGVMPHIANKADFLILHSYYTPYNQNSTVSTILNSASTTTSSVKNRALTDLNIYGGKSSLPLALTEWNIFAVGSKQATSYVNGMHLILVLGELIKANFGQSTRWDLFNGYGNGDAVGLFADGDPGMTKYTPRPAFYYMYYFQKYFGDKMVSSTSNDSNVVSYASTFSSGQSGVVLVNKGTTKQTVTVKLNNFNYGKYYSYYVLTGGTETIFSPFINVNGLTSTQSGGGPSNYTSLQPYRTEIIDNTIKIELPAHATIYALVENDTNTPTAIVPNYVQSENRFIVLNSPEKSNINLISNVPLGNIHIYSIMGAEVFSTSINQNEISIPKNKIGKRGIYLIKIDKYVKKIILK